MKNKQSSKSLEEIPIIHWSLQQKLTFYLVLKRQNHKFCEFSDFLFYSANFTQWDRRMSKLAEWPALYVKKSTDFWYFRSCNSSIKKACRTSKHSENRFLIFPKNMSRNANKPFKKRRNELVFDESARR